MGSEISARWAGPRVEKWLPVVIAAAFSFLVGLALARLAYESFFPLFPGLARPLPVLVMATAAAIISAVTTRYRRVRLPYLVCLLPLLLNVIWLFDPTIDPVRSRFLFGASLWSTAVLIAGVRVAPDSRQWIRLGPLFIGLALIPVYLLTMSHAVGEADTFEFQVVAPALGIAHPTGYPLYLLLGKVFSLIPMGSVAWRVNLASAVFAVSAVVVLYLLAYRLLRNHLPALVGAVALGLVPVFWKQAIIAEVYTLHALLTATALYLMVRVLDTQAHQPNDGHLWAFDNRKVLIALAFVLGLGMANHLTTLFLLPPAAVTFVFYATDTIRAYRRSSVSGPRSILWLLVLMAIAFAVPLLLYAYLPLRWQAVNGEPMGFSRFIEWVVGGRFQGALQWDAWRRDSARFLIVGRLLRDAWGWVYLGLAAVGLLYLLKRHWPVALITLLAAAGFTFYALNYYVPDLDVFLIPTHIVIAVWVAAGVGALFSLAGSFSRKSTPSLNNSLILGVISALLFILTLMPAIFRAADRWSSIDQSARDGGETWARGVLAQPLQRGAALLADSEKIAPLYYLQQIEGLRPDLDIMVLPDEATYRAELDSRIAAGRTVYLARFLPGLESAYHLRSAGPLVEVSPQPLQDLPQSVVTADQSVGPLRLVGYRLEPVAAVDPGSAALTLYWTLERPLDAGEALPVLYLRWVGSGVDDVAVPGQHPVSNYYPINAWRPGELVVDSHLLPLPATDCDSGVETCPVDIQIAAAPRFTASDELAWQTIATVPVARSLGPVGAPRRAFFDTFALDGVDLPEQARPGMELTFRYSGFGDGADLTLLLIPAHAVGSFIFPAGSAPVGQIQTVESAVFARTLEPSVEAGPHVVIALPDGELRSVCHWLAWPTTGCIVAEIDIAGAPLLEGAVNFADQIALLDIELPRPVIEPGDRLPVEITWQGLSSMTENYTVFVQVLDEQDRIVGQVDAWPVQGTLPTSQWQPGQVVRDPYVVQLSEDIQPGDYRVHVGLYLLGTLQRLPVLDASGQPVDDKVEVTVID